MSHTDKYAVDKKYEILTENSLRMLVSFCAKKMDAPEMWSALRDASRNENIGKLCAVLDEFMKIVLLNLPHATLSEDANLPNAKRK